MTPEQRDLIEAWYQGCQFRKVLSLLDRFSMTAESAVYRIQALCELDRAQEAAQFAQANGELFPYYGSLHYHTGIAYYLAGHGMGAIQQAFLKAISLGFLPAKMGLSFVAFAAKDYGRAVEFLTTDSFLEVDFEHARLLKLAQVLISQQDLAGAQAQLTIARGTLGRYPSLLRSLWNDICDVRLLRIKGDFPGAAQMAQKLLLQLDAQESSRLYRNAKELVDLSRAETMECDIALPDGMGVVDTAMLAAITRKPVLFSLFELLRTKGDAGVTKEEIIAAVWQENYNPIVHDDRVYKTIGRLRRLLGDDEGAPRTVLQKGRQYFLNHAVNLPVSHAPQAM